MRIRAGATDQTLYFNLIDATTGAAATGLTIADLDAVYLRDGSAPVKADLTEASAVDAAHSDNTAIEVDATNTPGLFRVDFLDAAFAAGVSRVQLYVNGAAILSSVIEVELDAGLGTDGKSLLSADAQDVSATLVVDGNGPTAAEVRTELDSNSTQLAEIVASLGAWTGTGVNTVLGAFKALLSKAASAPSDIGGTFSPATDSVEAIRDTAPMGSAMLAAGAEMTLTAAYDAAKSAAPTGAAMTLTAAYDAAKTAAQAGDEMDLVDAPNATAITAFVDAINAEAAGTTTITQATLAVDGVALGPITNADTDAAISGASVVFYADSDVSLTTPLYSAITDASGNFSVVVQLGRTYRVTVVASGYRSTTRRVTV